MRRTTGKFRGKEKQYPNRWIYGFYFEENGASFIWTKGQKSNRMWPIQVFPETVGEFVGFADIVEHDVHEGDIIQLDGAPELGARVVVFYEEAFCLATYQEYLSLQKGDHPYMNDYAHMTCLNEWSHTGLVRVIGNIYDNKELLNK